MHDEYHGMWYMLVPDISGNHNTTGIPGRYQVCISALRTTTQSPLRGKQQKFKQSVKGPANMNTWDSCWNAIYSVNNLEHRKAIVSSFSDACFSSVLMQVSPVCSHQAPVYSWGTAVHAAWANSSLSANRDGTASQSKRACGRNWFNETVILVVCAAAADALTLRIYVNYRRYELFPKPLTLMQLLLLPRSCSTSRLSVGAGIRSKWQQLCEGSADKIHTGIKMPLWQCGLWFVEGWRG